MQGCKALGWARSCRSEALISRCQPQQCPAPAAPMPPLASNSVASHSRPAMQVLALAQGPALAPGVARRAAQASPARLRATQQPQRLRRSLVARADGQGSSGEGSQQVRGGGGRRAPRCPQPSPRVCVCARPAEAWDAESSMTLVKLCYTVRADGQPSPACFPSRPCCRPRRRRPRRPRRPTSSRGSSSSGRRRIRSGCGASASARRRSRAPPPATCPLAPTCSSPPSPPSPR